MWHETVIVLSNLFLFQWYVSSRENLRFFWSLQHKKFLCGGSFWSAAKVKIGSPKVEMWLPICCSIAYKEKWNRSYSLFWFQQSKLKLNFKILMRTEWDCCKVCNNPEINIFVSGKNWRICERQINVLWATYFGFSVIDFFVVWTPT